MITLNFRKLLVPVDFSITSRKAIIHAAELAKKGDGTLILLHVRRKKAIADSIFISQELRAQAEEVSEIREQLKELAKEVNQKYGIAVQPVVTTGTPSSAITKAAERYCADMIVMGTRGSESDSSLFFGSNSSRIVAKTSIPVLTIRTENPGATFSKILLPVDLSAHSRQKVNAAMKLAKLFNASVHMLGLLPRGKENQRFKMEVIQKQIRKMATEKEIPFSANIYVTDYPALKTLAHARMLKAELIVSMTDEEAGSSWYIPGSFDKVLVDESPVPVLSIQPEIHEENIEPASLGGVW